MLISYFMRKIVFWQNHNNREHDNEDYLDKDISSNLEENIEFFKAILGNSNDIKYMNSCLVIAVSLMEH
ncbi:hypothetical protein [Tissierella sp. P1]|uniref:hypothetical protein n=1 Tax=Tissierella sp. P1 TaxID=1280483 RepID=UPI0019118869|nr:hypothetical protein [Tissierella sp. P1]